MKKLPLSKLNDLFSAISAEQKLYIPADNKGQAQFMPYVSGMEMTKQMNTVRSAKDLFFPQTENLMEFKNNGKTIEILDTREECEPFVVFGVRACDEKSFHILDTVFLAEPVDTYYQSRRENGTVVTLACSAPEETCFCTAFGIDATAPAGDVTCWMAGEYLYVSANTDKGTALVNGLSILEDGGELDVETAKAESKAILDKLPLNGLNLKQFGEKELMAWFNSPKWAELSQSCLGCGTCTYVCPTCQCYDIRDFDCGNGVERFRCWDSCMFSDFTMMAHGTNRPTQLERFRQRFMHKLVYYPNNNEGNFGCVGCGRCLQKCPIHMNIVKVVKSLGEEA